MTDSRKVGKAVWSTTDKPVKPSEEKVYTQVSDVEVAVGVQ